MNDRWSRSSPGTSGVRMLTMILLGLFFVAAAIFIFFPDEKAPGSQGKAATEKLVFKLNEVTLKLEHPEIPGAEKEDQLPGEEALESPQGKATAEELVFELNEVTFEPGPPEIPDAVKADQKKLGYNLGFEDSTGQGDVRASNFKIGVNYKVSENSTVGVEASRGIHDTQDAAAWGRSVDDENAAQAKYKLSF